MIHNEPDNYFGTSFIKALEMHSPESLPFKEVNSSSSISQLPHATTIVALRYKDGVVMAGDRRATMGHAISQRDIKKVLKADDYSGIAFAGTAALAVEMASLFQVELEHYEKMSYKRLTFDGKVNLLSRMVKGNFGAAMQGLAVVPLFGGYDLDQKTGRVFSYDILGGKSEELNFETTGSGGTHAKNWIKSLWNEKLTELEAVKIAIRSLIAAADEDAATGGVDLIRKIYPTVSVISKKGFDEYSHEKVSEIAFALLGSIEQGNYGTKK